MFNDMRRISVKEIFKVHTQQNKFFRIKKRIGFKHKIVLP